VSTVVERRAPSLRRVWAGGLRWLTALVAVVGVGNAAVLIAQSRDLVHSLYLNADNASALVLPALAGQAPSGAVVNLGNHPWYEPWWLMRATVGFSHYRGLWEAAPFVFALLSVALISLLAAWALGRTAGLLSAVALLAGSETLRGIVLVPESHGALLLHVALLGGGLLVVHRAFAAARRPVLTAIVVAIPLAALTAAGVTDQLLLIGGVAPFVLAPIACWLRLRGGVWRGVSIFAVATGAVSVIGGGALTHAMEEQGVIHAQFPIDFVTTEALFVNLGNTLGALTSLGDGAFFGQSASGSTLFVLASGVLVLAALSAVLYVVWRRLRAGEAISGEGSADVWSDSAPASDWGASSATAGSGDPAARGRRELFTTYWALVLVAVLLSFALTSVGNTTGNSRYLIAGWGALAALLGLLAGSRKGAAVALAAVAAFGALNLRAELASGVKPAGTAPSQRVAGYIEHFALAHGATIGYSGYWEAAPLTWETQLKIQVRPVVTCPAPTGFCPFYANNISNWYGATPVIRTFLVTDSGNVPGEVAAPPRSLGHPIAAAAVGEGYTVYVFNHDLAADLSTE
jgi:hypothetical protein